MSKFQLDTQNESFLDVVLAPGTEEPSYDLPEKKIINRAKRVERRTS